MIIGDRIKTLLGERRLSQAKLARLVGVDQSTINGLIRGGQRSSSHLHKIARELGTTPAYLSGETDDPASEAAALPRLTLEEQELLDSFRDLSPPNCVVILQLVRALSGRSPDPNISPCSTSPVSKEER